jgi:hypothetical protein
MLDMMPTLEPVVNYSSGLLRQTPNVGIERMPSAVHSIGLAGSLDRGSRGMQLKPKGADHTKNRCELGVPGWRQGFIEALSA